MDHRKLNIFFILVNLKQKMNASAFQFFFVFVLECHGNAKETEIEMLTLTMAVVFATRYEDQLNFYLKFELNYYM